MRLNIAIIGYKFMGKAHSFAFNTSSIFCPEGITPVKKVICGRTEHLVKQAMEQYGWEEYATDWREVVERDDIDIVDVATPTNTHPDIAIAAMRAGKHVFCEKPIALTVEKAQEMVKVAKETGVRCMLGHNYRRVPAVALAKQMVESGELGTIHNYRAVYLQDWLLDPNVPADWQLDKKLAGSGPLDDLGSHMVDLAQWFLGEIDSVSSFMETIVKQRPKKAAQATLTSGLGGGVGDTSQMVDVTVEDSAAFLARFKSGVVGTFETGRMAGGRKNHNCFEINGSKGTICFDFERMNELQYWSADDPLKTQGFRRILVTEPGAHPYCDKLWPAGHIIGYENTFALEFADFFRNIKDGTDPYPSLEDGLRTCKVLRAVERAAVEKRWVEV